MTKLQRQINGCISKCCSQFHLLGDTQEDYIREGEEGNEESKFIGEMLVYLGPDEDHPDWPVYTCKHWDRDTGKCTVYEQRPSMCRTYPDGKECAWEGCEYIGQNPSRG